MADGKMSAVRRRTKKLIQDSFIGLLEDKPLQKITVRDLCSAADINRATFYRYYVDLNELNDELADNLFQKLFCNLADRSVARGSADKEAARTLFVPVRCLWKLCASWRKTSSSAAIFCAVRRVLSQKGCALLWSCWFIKTAAVRFRRKPD